MPKIIIDYDTDPTWYESIRHRFTVMLVSMQTLRKMPEKTPYLRIDDYDESDVVGVCGIEMKDSDGEDSVRIIDSELFEDLDVCKKQLFADAIAESEKKYPATIQRADTFFKSPARDRLRNIGVYGNEAYELFTQLREICGNDDMCVVTTEDGTHGAKALLYKGILDEVAEMLGDGFYIIPTSTHEVFFVRDGDCVDLSELESLVWTIHNEGSSLATDEQLSDTVYHYDRTIPLLETTWSYKERGGPKLKELAAREKEAMRFAEAELRFPF